MSRMLKILQTPPEMIKKADVLESIGQWMDENPLVSKILIGGGIGALGGAVLGDGRNTLRNVIGGGLMGAGGGALYHYFTSPGTPAPNAGGNAGAGGGKGQGNATTPGTPAPKAEEVSQNPGTGQGEQPASVPQEQVVNEQPKVTTQGTTKVVKQEIEPTYDEDSWIAALKKKHKFDAIDYEVANEFIKKRGWDQQPRFIQWLRRELGEEKFDVNKIGYIYQWMNKGVRPDIKDTKGLNTYLTRMLQYGHIIGQNGRYENGAARFTGNPEIDHLLAIFYGGKEYARKNAINWYNVETLEDLIRAMKWAEIHKKPDTPGEGARIRNPKR